MTIVLSMYIVLAVISVYYFCFIKRGIEINHILLFTFGMMYYWIVPIFVGEFNLYTEEGLMYRWHDYYNNIESDMLLIFVLYIFLFSFLFYFGSFLGEIIFKKKKNNITKVYIEKNIIIILFVFLLPIIGWQIFLLKDYFFNLYTAEVNSDKGGLIALNIIIFSMAIIYSNILENDRKMLPSLKMFSINPIMYIYFLLSIGILSMGGRLYFIASIIMLFVYVTVYNKPLKVKTLLLISVISVSFMGAFGIFRLGQDGLGLSSIMFYILAEPIYTSFSLISFIGNNEIELFNWPIFLISDFINIIPSVMLPNKTDYLLNPSEYGYIIDAPLGAFSSYVSLNINFGLFGSLIIVFIFGLFLSVVKNKSLNNMYFKTIYILLSGWIPFALFRDPFSVSLVKQMFQLSIIIPILIITAVIIFTQILSIKKSED